jgi:hypothetical protein
LRREWVRSKAWSWDLNKRSNSASEHVHAMDAGFYHSGT